MLPTSAPKPSEDSGANSPLPSNDHRDSAGKHHRHASKRRLPSPSAAFGHSRDALLTSKQHHEGREDPPKTFIIDVKGDVRNSDYGSNYGVPSYPRPPVRVALAPTPISVPLHAILRQPTVVDIQSPSRSYRASGAKEFSELVPARIQIFKMTTGQISSLFNGQNRANENVKIGSIDIHPLGTWIVEPVSWS